MKPTNKFVLAALLGISTLTSCNNDLTENIFSELTEESFTYTNAYQAIGSSYTRMRDLLSHTNYYMSQESTSDAIVMPANASGWDDGGIYRRMHLHTWNSENVQMTNMWNTYYAGVINTNRIIDLLETDKITAPAGVSKESLISEVRTVRAFYYWLLLDNFGDVPLITTRTDELPGITPRKEVYNFVVSELVAAIPTLSEENTTLYYGRFNKWGGKALLANVYLNSKVYVGEEKWAEAIKECDDIIASGKYQLAADLKSTFATNNESSPEIIFAIPFDENQASGFNVHMFSFHGSMRSKYGMLATPWGAGSAKGVTQFINTFDEADERLPAYWNMGPQFALDGTTPLLGSYDKGGQPIVLVKELPDGLYTGEADGYRMNKFEIKRDAQGSLSNDFPFFRYTQILLIKAECLVRMGRQSEAAPLITSIRTRAFKDNPAKAIVTPEELLEDSKYQYGYVENYNITDPGDQTPVAFGRVLDELGWEFSWEGHRRRDMIRFGVYTSKSWLSHKPNGSHRAVFPIPQIALNSNGKLEQNPAYK